MTNVGSVGKIEVACEEVPKGKHLPLVAKNKTKQKNRTAWLSGRMREEGTTGDLVCERPVGEEAADP